MDIEMIYKLKKIKQNTSAARDETEE